MFKISEAKRERVKLMVALTGPSGAGKSLSALKLAYGITNDWTKIAYADTENGSALYYAGENNVFPTGPWQHIPFNPENFPDGYHPNNWIKLINHVEKQPEKFQVLILDSISHEWDGVGGALQLAERIGGKGGFGGWKVVTPLHQNFIDKMRNSPLHIIATMRSKQDYVAEQNEKGKTSFKKVGLKSTQREGVDYEFGVIFDIEMSHLATTGKDRTGLFAERGPFQIEPSTGRELLEWSQSGVIPEKTAPPATQQQPAAGSQQQQPEQKKTGNVYDPTNLEHSGWLQTQCEQAGLTKHIKAIEKELTGKPGKELQKILTKYKSELPS